MGTVNGVPVSWSDMTCEVALDEGRRIKVEDMTAVAWKRMIERKLVRGARGNIRGKTTGQVSYEASATFTEGGVAALEAALAEVNAANIALVEFTITCLWTPPRGRRNRKVEIYGCSVLEDGFTNALGVDEAGTEYKFMPTKIVHYPDAKGPGNTLLDLTASAA
jgi:hypothetical protein